MIRFCGLYMRRNLYYLCLGSLLCLPNYSSASEVVSDIYSDLVSPVQESKNSSRLLDSTVPASVTWSVLKGQDLRSVMSQWANEAGWDLVWDSEQSYKLLAAASFKNVTFEQAVSDLFDAVGNIEPRLYVSLYKKNKVVLVSSRPEF
ncbi:TPA: toxin co-regulated pilus biosynthesis Q family protein [Escherichia coli]|nr:toxin co-regulated pilus biosynthesis Q family protein [Escherichia coli]